MEDSSASKKNIDYFLPDNYMFLVKHFETGELPFKIWKQHRAHLIAATWYCYCFDFNIAIAQLRKLIPQYNNKHGVFNSETSGYHDTLTIFWLSIVDKLVKEKRPFVSFRQAAEIVLLKYGYKKTLFQKFYSIDIVSSVKARQEWIPPDLEAV